MHAQLARFAKPFLTAAVQAPDLSIESEPPPPPAIVPDTQPPLISLLGDATLKLKIYDPYVEYGATAMDARDGPVPVVTSGVVNTNVTSVDGKHPVVGLGDCQASCAWQKLTASFLATSGRLGRIGKPHYRTLPRPTLLTAHR